jgi:phenylacetate-CoA ligase
MSLYTRICSNLLFPLQERLKHHSTVAVRRSLEQTQWWTPEQLAQLQLQRLRALLQGAAARVPYYQQLFRQLDFDANQIQSLADLQRLPFLTKSLIREHFDALKAHGAQGLAPCSTGGSSGEPLRFLIPLERVSHDVAAKWRATRWWDVDIGDREIVLWGSPIELGGQDRVKQIRDRVMRTKLLPAFAMSEAKLDEFVREIRAFRPKMLFGYPSALAYVAEHASKRGVRLDDLGIKVAFVTAEKLYDAQRLQIERQFACKVANGYGGRDAGFIAHQCPVGGAHITAEDIIVEIIGADDLPVAAGQPGEIVVTHLATADYPFIRYRTGDVGVLDTAICACGRGLPLLKEVQGRKNDFVKAVDGTIMHGAALTYVLRDLPGLLKFKVVQESLERVTVQLVTETDNLADVAQKIVNDFKARLGASVCVDVQRVAEIAPEKSGKYRFVISRIL